MFQERIETQPVELHGRQALLRNGAEQIERFFVHGIERFLFLRRFCFPFRRPVVGIDVIRVMLTERENETDVLLGQLIHRGRQVQLFRPRRLRAGACKHQPETKNEKQGVSHRANLGVDEGFAQPQFPAIIGAPISLVLFPLLRRRTFILALSCLVAGQALAASFLFDATHAETAGNADWVIDADNGTPQRFPTPDQSTVTASTSETYWKGAISAWGIALVKRGHHVETLPSGTAITFQNASNAQDLSNYKVFVVDEPNKSFTAAEKTAIVKFVQNGGSLFMVADHEGSDRNGDGKDSGVIWNDLFANNTVQAAPFGLVINSNTISPNNESCDSSASDPITHGAAGTITQFVFNDGASITIDPTKNSSVKGAVWTSSSHANSNVMVAYGTFGAGKFVAIGDSSPIDDGTGASGDTLFDGWDDGGGDDGDLVINASLWLAAATAGAPPVNDNFAGATLITGSSASVSGTNVNATKETGEPNHAGNAGGKSVWWTWTAPASGNVVIDTIGSTFDTLLGVYTGTAVNALTQVACG